jgi:hypothetical protein
MAWPLRFLKGILIEFFGGGGENRGLNLRSGGRITPHRPVNDLNDTTINKCTRGGGWNGRGVAWRLRFYKGYLFIGPNRGQNSVHGLPLKWAPTFLVTFLLLPNLRVRIYVDSTKIMSVRQNGGKSKQLPKLVSMGCDGLTLLNSDCQSSNE